MIDKVLHILVDTGNGILNSFWGEEYNKKKLCHPPLSSSPLSPVLYEGEGFKYKNLLLKLL